MSKAKWSISKWEWIRGTQLSCRWTKINTMPDHDVRRMMKPKSQLSLMPFK